MWLQYPFCFSSIYPHASSIFDANGLNFYLPRQSRERGRFFHTQPFRFSDREREREKKSREAAAHLHYLRVANFFLFPLFCRAKLFNCEAHSDGRRERKAIQFVRMGFSRTLFLPRPALVSIPLPRFFCDVKIESTQLRYIHGREHVMLVHVVHTRQNSKEKSTFCRVFFFLSSLSFMFFYLLDQMQLPVTTFATRNTEITTNLLDVKIMIFKNMQ